MPVATDGATDGPYGETVYCHRPQEVWTAPPSTDRSTLSDEQATNRITRRPEFREENYSYNNACPSETELDGWRSVNASDYSGYEDSVSGCPIGLTPPWSTDDLIQWTAFKWGIPEDLIRAQMVRESSWFQQNMGDDEVVTHSAWLQYPSQFQRSGDRVYESAGLGQIKWRPSPSTQGIGTEPMRWVYTAFNLDYYGATIRGYYDSHCRGVSCSSTEEWKAINAWCSGSWNSVCSGYQTGIQNAMTARTWETLSFQNANYSPPS